MRLQQCSLTLFVKKLCLTVTKWQLSFLFFALKLSLIILILFHTFTLFSHGFSEKLSLVFEINVISSKLLRFFYIWIRSPLILLSPSLVRPQESSLASYSFKTLKLVGKRAALSWTFSIVLISPSRYGFQTGTAYSKCGLTNEIYNFFQSWLTLLIKNFLNIPKTLLAL